MFPLCPGVEGGTFDPERYAFHNQPVNEVIDDMQYVLSELRKVNPSAQVILTVSPVPLMATAAPDAHVLTATTYSKAVLRVAAQSLTEANSNVHYFPSFEIITGTYNRGSYYADDLRNVTEDGVSHVMRLFLKHAAGTSLPAATARKPEARGDTDRKQDDFLAQAKSFVEVECEEAALDQDDT